MPHPGVLWMPLASAHMKEALPAFATQNESHGTSFQMAILNGNPRNCRKKHRQLVALVLIVKNPRTENPEIHPAVANLERAVWYDVLGRKT
jgi:hypothetical protein